jgi:hypothetical protein
VDLTNDYTVKSLIHGIADGLGGDSFSLDLASCTGYAWGYVSGISAADKEKITAITLPPTVTEITGGVNGAGAFAGFSSLTACTAPGVTDLGDYAFQGCTALPSITLNATTIGTGAFYGCTVLTTVNLPQATSIGGSAFSGCTTLTTVSLPQATTIGSSAFFGCTTLGTVSLLLATSIGSNAFYGCTTLGTVTLDAATTIGSYAFQNCTTLPSITLNAAETIGGSAFSGCTSLATVSLPAATSIGGSAFSGCTALATVSLPAAQTIGDYAFLSTGAQSLAITLGSAPPAVGTNLFQGITSSAPNGPKAVTVNHSGGAGTYGSVPSNTTNDNWVNAFRGGGWDKATDTYGTSTVNANVTVTISS